MALPIVRPVVLAAIWPFENVRAPVPKGPAVGGLAPVLLAPARMVVPLPKVVPPEYVLPELDIVNITGLTDAMAPAPPTAPLMTAFVAPPPTESVPLVRVMAPLSVKALGEPVAKVRFGACVDVDRISKCRDGAGACAAEGESDAGRVEIDGCAAKRIIARPCPDGGERAAGQLILTEPAKLVEVVSSNCSVPAPMELMLKDAPLSMMLPGRTIEPVPGENTYVLPLATAVLAKPTVPVPLVRSVGDVVAAPAKVNESWPKFDVGVFIAPVIARQSNR